MHQNYAIRDSIHFGELALSELSGLKEPDVKTGGQKGGGVVTFRCRKSTHLKLGISILENTRVNPYILCLPIPKGLTMSKLVNLIKAIVTSFKSKEELDDRYLSQANDACDLERRMHELDIRDRDSSRGLIWGYRAW
jgi:hypothetical protein